MRRFLLIMLLLSTSVSANAAENEIKLGMTTHTIFTDNYENASSGKRRDAVSFGIGPALRFDSSATTYEMSGGYSLGYLTSTKKYSNAGVRKQRDEVTHHLNARGEYRPNDRWTLGLSNRLRIESDLARASNGEDQIDLSGRDNKQTLRNRLNANLRYGVTPRFSVSSNGGYVVVSREDKDLSDTDQFSGSAQGNYVVGVRDTIGGGATIRHQIVSGAELGGVRKTTTDYYGVFASWQHRLSSTFLVSASGGPAWVNSRQVFDAGGHDTSKNFDYFANAQVLAEFDRGSAAIVYSRSSSDFANTSTAYFVDNIGVTVTRSMTRKLSLTARSSWNQRTAVQNFSNVNFVDKITQWQATGAASYQLTRELRASFTVDYLRQEEANEDPIDRVRASVRFNYNAKAIRF